jgi:hypothetical protein
MLTLFSNFIGGTVHHRYDAVMKGFAASFPKDHVSKFITSLVIFNLFIILLDALESHPDVEYVEADGEVSI